ncbi:MAG: ABC transporter permease subunit [Pseudomonadota bacterium]
MTLAVHISSFRAALRRQLLSYFTTPLAYVFIAVFLIALGLFTWEGARFFDTARADLGPFFVWHPWLYMIFTPALAMGLWADETAEGTDELLFSLPLSLPGLIAGKLCAAWLVTALMLALTLPMWLTVSYLGAPDHAAIAISYLMSFLMAGAYLAISAALSAVSRSQVVAFVLGVVCTFLLTAAGWPLVLSGVTDLFGPGTADAIAAFSFLSHFEAAQRGVLELRALVYFFSVMVLGGGLTGLWAARVREG